MSEQIFVRTNLSYLRKKQGLTQVALSDKLGIKHTPPTCTPLPIRGAAMQPTIGVQFSVQFYQLPRKPVAFFQVFDGG